MTTTIEVQGQDLDLPQELVLMLLNEESGYFHQVPGWNMNCVVIGAVLAELSFMHKLDSDLDSMFVIDSTETGQRVLDLVLAEIASDPVARSTQYWIERLAQRADDVVNMVLEDLVEIGILEHHDGDFWTLSRSVWQSDLYDDSVAEFVRTRIARVILAGEIPSPRDSIIVALMNTCGILPFMFPIDDESDERIQFVINLDEIGRSISAAVSDNMAGPLLRRSALAKPIPRVPLRKIVTNPHLRTGNVPALMTDLTKEHGPVFEIKPPFKESMLFLAGAGVNHWVQRNGRNYLRTKDYFADFEKVYGANGVLPALDGADHFRLRKSLASAYSRGRLAGRLEDLYGYIRGFMSDWAVGDAYQATLMCRSMINAQISPLMISVESQDLLNDLATFKERALTVKIMKALPDFMLRTPGMRRREKRIDELLGRVQDAHTSAQRMGKSRTLADDLLSLHSSDPQFMPESNLRFQLSAALIASVYMGDCFSFALYAMVSQPEMYAMLQKEADALFDNGDPEGDDFNLESLDVTHRFVMETLRMYPIVPMSIRNVMNTCVVEGFELPVGSRLFIAQTATHYMPEFFPDPFKFDIDRYKAPRNEHRSPAYAPYGLGTHMCLGSRWMDLQLTINVLMVAHYFNLEIAPSNYKFKINAIPSSKPSKKLHFRVAEQRRELPV